MRLACTLLGGLAATALAAASPSSAHPSAPLGRPVHLERRQDQQQQPASQAQQEALYQQAMTDPVGAAKVARALPFIAGQFATGDLYKYNVAGDGQLPWNSGVYYQPEATVNGSVDGGWQALPEIPDFQLNRTWTVKDGAIMPFYQTANYDPKQIKRAVLVMPGKPRDCWKYTSMMQNALSVEAANSTSGVTNSSVLILGPCWMNSDDQKAGAVQPNELYWYGSQWQRGELSRGPGSASISTYRVLDGFLDMLFDKDQFPALNRVVLAGHSMGAQMVQRYAMLKKSRPYDANVAYWVGNPGSYAWPSSERTYANSSCADVDTWPYGVGGDTKQLPAYARSDVEANKDAVVATYRSRHVHYSLGLLDNGQGDTSCQAATQGANHLERGCDIVTTLGDMAGGFPSNHTLNLMPNVSHQDYEMMSYNISLYRLFADGLDTQEGYTAAAKGAGSRSTGAGGKGGSSSAAAAARMDVASLQAGLALGAGLAAVAGVLTAL
ncbi:uncharacterized protein PFL1_04266 [Pseudozyma flocculosa PF-1]|uniref:Uncharacterized protein n=2 Tax=Pseudozyma flocculosa TaxID=84751 RepID=A0A5C3ETD0_9BASI|nr:uncharacterized protein PFL1_04266 [Pseudozyma flocculosa PF-1]EPQ28440.1 hypothetical protein PFL1_04266 [Pseudozyma flocculosa PF-1]SPO35613.1 uncharacterized protein PSFLO_01084 [Pseudozyma flocculosa]